jgi:hypothetical protein
MDDVGGACSTHGEDEKLFESLKEREHSEGLYADGSIILKWTLN